MKHQFFVHGEGVGDRAEGFQSMSSETKRKNDISLTCLSDFKKFQFYFPKTKVLRVDS